MIKPANIDINTPFITTPTQTLSFLQCDQHIKAISQALVRDGVQTGQLIAIWGENSLNLILMALSLWRIGAVTVLLNERWPINKIEIQLNRVGCKILLGERTTVPKELSSSIRYYPIEDVAANFSYAGRIHKKCDSNKQVHAATVMFTSGSSGTPKAIFHLLKQHLENARGCNENISFQSGDRWLLALPIYHVAGLAILFRAWLGGGAVVLQNPQKSLHENLLDSKITHVSLVATQLYRLLNEINEAPQNLKAVLVGGSAVPATLIQSAVSIGLPIFTTYGSTEMASQITTTAPGDEQNRLFTSGRILNGREIKLLADGEICVKGDCLFSGYIENSRVISGTDSEGWYHTGDNGKLNENGYLVVQGRKDNMFISGGENIKPEEIEKCLLEFPGIEQAMVVPVEHAEFGQRPVAFIKMLLSNILDEKILRKFLEKRLARFQIPDYFLNWPVEFGTSGLKPSRTAFTNLARSLIKSS